MSGFSANLIFNPSDFLIFRSERLTTLKSHTAAHPTKMSAGRALWTDSYISSADTTSRTCRFGWLAGPILFLPKTRVTFAPDWARAIAMALPCLPEEKLLMCRTLSMRSIVPPDVTMAHLPSSVDASRKWSSITAIIEPGSAILPIPISPQANMSACGEMTVAPSDFAISRLR